jgi:hypothetical protein
MRAASHFAGAVLAAQADKQKVTDGDEGEEFIPLLRGMASIDPPPIHRCIRARAAR